MFDMYFTFPDKRYIGGEKGYFDFSEDIVIGKNLYFSDL